MFITQLQLQIVRTGFYIKTETYYKVAVINLGFKASVYIPSDLWGIHIDYPQLF